MGGTRLRNSRSMEWQSRPRGTVAAVNPSYLCPACGFLLSFDPRGRSLQTEAICPCCGIHFGYDDRIGDDPEAAYTKWRAWWMLQGMRWWSTDPVPPDFNPDEQLARLIESSQNE